MFDEFTARAHPEEQSLSIDTGVCNALRARNPNVDTTPGPLGKWDSKHSPLSLRDEKGVSMYHTSSSSPNESPISSGSPQSWLDDSPCTISGTPHLFRSKELLQELLSGIQVPGDTPMIDDNYLTAGTEDVLYIYHPLLGYGSTLPSIYALWDDLSQDITKCGTEFHSINRAGHMEAIPDTRMLSQDLKPKQEDTMDVHEHPTYGSAGFSTNVGTIEEPRLGETPLLQGHHFPSLANLGDIQCRHFKPEEAIPDWRQIRPVGSDALSHASNKRREREPAFRCPYPSCGKSFTAKHNLKSS
ncbi:hypothetical protein VNI00_018815 [Paramarasmius palmivorus]|uniref:C2H2-type domain-containing protein n=1 Tax=Paramarasmius palmivorus TaxID=297713 RepID=A0AAW0ATA8_9AGAR